MAGTSKNIILQGLSGAVAKQLVFKTYAGKTVVSKFPDMSSVKPSAAQESRRMLFREAVSFAKAINNDPVARQKYASKLPAGSSVYQAALKDYLHNTGK
ncbi:MAG: hypothetical protein JWQ30_1756 [Sediminibacterium sp.]|nr:hypothetical protein [Sediminibacterium sp.]